MKIYTQTMFELNASDLYWIVHEHVPEVAAIRFDYDEETGHIASGDFLGDVRMVLLDDSGELIETEPHGANFTHEALEWIREFMRERDWDAECSFSWSLLEAYAEKVLPDDPAIVVVIGRATSAFQLLSKASSR